MEKVLRITVTSFDYSNGKEWAHFENTFRYIGQDEVDNSEEELKNFLNITPVPYRLEVIFERIDLQKSKCIDCHVEYWDDSRDEAIDKIIFILNEMIGNVYDEYENFIKWLEQFPKIDTSFAYTGENLLTDSENIVEAQEIRWEADTEEKLKENIMYSLRNFFKGKKIWIRILPVIRYVEEENKWHGRARFAVFPND